MATANTSVEHRGQLFVVSWPHRFVDTAYIPAGQNILPVEIPKTKKAAEFSDLHLAQNDLEFARKCFREAIKVHESESIPFKALCNAGTVSYTRAFGTGVRGFKLTPTMFDDKWSAEQKELHNYLFEIRQKHIAHSVNNFERADAVGVIVTSPSYERQAGVTGIGVTMLEFVGLSPAVLTRADSLIEISVEALAEHISELALEIHAELRAFLDGGGKWVMAPFMRNFPTPSDVGTRRKP